MNAPQLADLAALKRGARATWGAGDYPAIAQRLLWAIGPRIVAAAGVQPGEDVLDVACGTGNAALRAAQAGGRVVGVDLTPELFDAGRALAAQAGVEIEWVHGDAEDLPFEDESFDAVLSVFGCMFAPRHAVTAGELVRVLRPGGRFALACWTPDGGMGAFNKVVGPYMPPPSPLAQVPALWGTEAHVEELFAGTGVELEFERAVAPQDRFESPEAALEFMEQNFGPLMMVRQLTEAAGHWPELRAQLVAMFAREDPQVYLQIVGRKAAA